MLLEVLRVPRVMMNEVSNREFLGHVGPLAFIFDEEIPGIVHLWQCTATLLGKKNCRATFYMCVCAWTLVLYRAQIRYDGPKCWRSFVLLSAFGATFVMNNKARNRSTDMVVGRKKNLPHSLPPLHNHLVSQFSKPVCW